MTAYRVTFPRVVRAEWLKITSLRSTWVMLSLIVVLPVGLAAAAGARSHEASAGNAFLGVDVVSLLLGVFGILTVTGEYGSGLALATFAAVPRRVPVLAAKALVLTLAGLPVLLATSVAAFWVNRLLAGHASPEPAAVRATVGAAVAPLALALVGLGIGALVRHTAAAITAYVLSMLVLPAVLQGVLSGGTGQTVVRYVPVAAAQALYAEGNPFRMLAPGPAYLVLLAWTAGALALGGLLVWRRDP